MKIGRRGFLGMLASAAMVAAARPMHAFSGLGSTAPVIEPPAVIAEAPLTVYYYNGSIHPFFMADIGEMPHTVAFRNLMTMQVGE